MSAEKRKWGKFRATNGKTYYMPKRFCKGLTLLHITNEQPVGQITPIYGFKRALSAEETKVLYEDPFCMFTEYRPTFIVYARNWLKRQIMRIRYRF